jgi:hypothetical protein
LNFQVVYDFGAGDAVLTWEVSEVAHDGFRISVSPNTEFTITDYDSPLLNTVTIPIDYTLYGTNFITWTIRTYTDSAQGTAATFPMYFIAAPINVFGEWQSQNDFVYLAWNYPIDPTATVDNWRIIEQNVGYDAIFPDETLGFAEISGDPSWVGQTLYFEIAAEFAGKQSQFAAVSPIEIPNDVFLGNNPGFYSSGLGFESDVPTPLNSVASRSARLLNEPIIISYNEFGLVQSTGTISFWFKADPMGDTAGYGLFTTSVNDTNGYSIGLGSGGSIVYGMGPDPNVYDPGDTSLLSGWHNLILRYQIFNNEGTWFNAFDMYIDGVLVQDNVQSNAGGNDTPSWTDVRIGVDSYLVNNGGSAFTGSVVDFRSTIDQWGLNQAQDVFAGIQLAGNSVRIIYTFQEEEESTTGVIDSSQLYETPT